MSDIKKLGDNKMKNKVRKYEVVRDNGEKVYVEAQYCYQKENGILVFGNDDARVGEEYKNSVQLVSLFSAGSWVYVNEVKDNV